MPNESTETARLIGEQIHKTCIQYEGNYVGGVECNERKEILPLYCPICSKEPDEIQPLSSVGDNREELFCPHCDLRLKIIIFLDEVSAYTPGEPSDGKVGFIDTCPACKGSGEVRRVYKAEVKNAAGKRQIPKDN